MLLCSLLVGFGQDAYVCLGTKGSKEEGGLERHSWVVCLGPLGTTTPGVGAGAGGDGDRTPRARAHREVNVFWESVTGYRYTHTPYSPEDPPPPRARPPAYPYRTISCIFNHRAFFANCQVPASISFIFFFPFFFSF